MRQTIWCIYWFTRCKVCHSIHKMRSDGEMVFKKNYFKNIHHFCLKIFHPFFKKWTTSRGTPSDSTKWWEFIHSLDTTEVKAGRQLVQTNCAYLAAALLPGPVLSSVSQFKEAMNLFLTIFIRTLCYVLETLVLIKFS